MNTTKLMKKFAIATVVVACLFAVSGLLGISPGGRGGGSSGDSATGSGEDQVAATGGSETATETLHRNGGTKPLPEIIEFWRQRSENQPLDYLSRTELGFALVASATASADLDIYAEAETALRDALRLNPSHHQARLGLASTLMARHDFDGALTQTGLVQDARPGSLPALALEGDAKIGIGDTEGAAIAYRHLLDRERSAATVARLARLRWAQGDPAGAVEAATEALALSRELDLRPESQAFYHFQFGHFLFKTGSADEAIEAYRTARSLDQNQPGASEGLAFALAATGRLTEAAEQYRLLLANGQAADLHGHYAEVLAKLGREADAEEQFRLADQVALADADGNPAERRHIAGYLATTNPALAITLAQADLAERQDVGAYDTLAWALYNAGRIDEAADAINLALASGTGDSGVLYHAAAINHASGDSQSAFEQVTAALALAPDFHPTEADDARELLAELSR